MLVIETSLKEVPGKGIGLFTLKPIKKGDIVWKNSTILTKKYSRDEVSAMDDIPRKFIEKYSILEKDGWLLDLDNARFLNHSNDPNIVFCNEDNGYALKDIAAGEELTSDYRAIDLKPINFVDIS